MIRTHRMRKGTAIAFTGAVAAALTIAAVPASATAAPSQPTGTAIGQATKPVEADPVVLKAVQRDLKLTEAQARTRLAKEHRAALLEQDLRKRLGTRFAGAWLSKDASTFTVATTDRKAVKTIESAGAEAKVVTRSVKKLDAVKARLDRAKGKAAASVTGWYVDVTTNSVVVQTKSAKPGRAFVGKSGVSKKAVKVETTDDSPRLFYDVRGGDAYYPGSSRCSIGFSVQGGFATAGHCGSVGTSTSGFNRVAQGTVRGSVFPGNDMGWVQVNSNWTPQPLVNNYQGGNVTVQGGTEAAVGASVCRSGSTTGPRLGLVCGTIQAKNQTVNYPQGTVRGLTRTTVCAEPGDSGGSWISNGQAQGVTSGGSGNCSSGGTTFFQPLQPLLSRFGLTLVTSGNPDPPDPPTTCENLGSSENGSLSSNQTQVHPGGRWYQSGSSATHRGCLDGPSGSDFDLYLQKWSGSSWGTVSRSITPGPDEEISYNGTSGYYRYVVHAYSGSGSYTVRFNQP